MNYLYGRSAAAALLPAALTIRMFIGLAVDYPVAMNAAWMCPIIGFIICLPFCLALRHAQSIGNASAWENICSGLPPAMIKALELVFALALAYDAAAMVRITASSSNIIALGDSTVHLLILPLSLTAAAVILMGGDALGNSVRIFMRILALFLLIVLLAQLKAYRIGWLAPILGSGMPSVIGGAIYCAGCIALMTLLCLPALPDRNQTHITRYVLVSVLISSLLLITQQMSFPVMPETEYTQAARIELILSNGRISLYPQFALNVLWFAGMLLLFSAEITGSAAYLHRIIPAGKAWLPAVVLTATITLAAVFNPTWMQNASAVIRILFPVLGGLIALPLIHSLLLQKGKTK